DGHVFSRKEIVLEVAETDGIGHVDAELTPEYYRFTRQHSHGHVKWLFDEEPGQNVARFEPLHPPHLITIRQIAHEVLISLIAPYGYNGSQHYPFGILGCF